MQVRALEDFYKKVKTSNEERLEQLDKIGHVIIPRIALTFVALFWTVGLTKFNDPELDMATVTEVLFSPILIIGLIITLILVVIIKKIWKHIIRN